MLVVIVLFMYFTVFVIVQSLGLVFLNVFVNLLVSFLWLTPADALLTHFRAKVK
jgi:hypothetical protein